MALDKKGIKERAQDHIKKSGLKTRNMESGVLKPFLIRIGEFDLKRLKTHFQGKGLSVSAGLRMAIKIYMDREGI
jgi:hypothetical protein